MDLVRNSLRQAVQTLIFMRQTSKPVIWLSKDNNVMRLDL